jgi:uncharacterized protein (DUF433 family)
MPKVIYAHIDIGLDGRAYISAKQTKVEEIVLDHLAHSWDAQEIHRQHPHLSLAEIYSALAYYYDHRAEVDDQIAQGLSQVNEIRNSLPISSVRLKLQAQGLLP